MLAKNKNEEMSTRISTTPLRAHVLLPCHRMERTEATNDDAKFEFKKAVMNETSERKEEHLRTMQKTIEETSKPSSCVPLASKGSTTAWVSCKWTTVILAARQSQRRRGSVLDMVADDSQTLILFDPSIGVRNLDATCRSPDQIDLRPPSPCKSAQCLNTTMPKSPNTSTPAGSSRRPCHSLLFVLYIFPRLLFFPSNLSQRGHSYVEVLSLHIRFLSHTTFGPSTRTGCRISCQGTGSTKENWRKSPSSALLAFQRAQT